MTKPITPGNSKIGNSRISIGRSSFFALNAVGADFCCDYKELLMVYKLRGARVNSVLHVKHRVF